MMRGALMQHFQLYFKHKYILPMYVRAFYKYTIAKFKNESQKGSQKKHFLADWYNWYYHTYFI